MLVSRKSFTLHPRRYGKSVFYPFAILLSKMRPTSSDGERYFYARIALYAILDYVASLSICQIISMFAIFPNVIYYWQRVFFTLNVSLTRFISIVQQRMHAQRPYSDSKHPRNPNSLPCIGVPELPPEIHFSKD